ncbi:MAG TPA: hypothetical protein VGK08_06585 [Thermoanaerobaculia bacterium]|jgi:hypothetical protein
MSARITRRTAARLLLSSPAALVVPRLLETAPSPIKSRVKAALSPSERRQFEKSIAQMRSTVRKIRKLAIPMGSEPAFVFRPLLRRK